MTSRHSFCQTRSGSLHGAGGSRGMPGSFPRAPSVHGGAGGVRISLSFTSPSCLYENEHSFKKDLEMEVEGLRKTLDDLTIVTTDLEQEVEGLRKELILMKKRHEQEMEERHVPNELKVNVKVDTTPGEDLIKVLEDMRQEYESIIKKKHQDLDAWTMEESKSSVKASVAPKIKAITQESINGKVILSQVNEIQKLA
ncbi:hypothetical protein MC885_008138 [Smutsia gigantea]|nr:hypothetical protein MC885_008138 [Smutsia gigantea]